MMNIGYNLNYYKKYPLQQPPAQQGVNSTENNENTKQIQNIEETDKIANTPNMPPPKTPPEVAQFMISIGIQPTNSKDGDRIAIENRLNQLESQATTPAKLNEVKQLRSVWAEIVASGPSGDTPFQKQSTGQDKLTAMDQMATLNKWFFKL